MPTDVLMPQMGESITEGTLTKWLKKPGDTVVRDEPLFEISTDKVDAEIPSPVAGTLGDIRVTEGATVVVNTVVCTVSEGNGASVSAPAMAPETTLDVRHTEETVTPAAEATSIRDTAVNNGTSLSASPGPTSDVGIDVLMPQMGESITEGTLTKWLKKVGDTVQRDEPIFEISTDKVDAEIPSPTGGVLTEIRVLEGSTVSINTVVGTIGGGAAPLAAAPKPVQPALPSVKDGHPTQASQAASPVQSGPIRSSPLVRKIASENSLDLSTVTGTGASGRITKQDIVGHLQRGTSPRVATQPAAQFEGHTTAASRPAPDAATHATYIQAQSAPATTQPARASFAPSSEPGELVPMSKMRAIIAKRMVESKQTSAHVHTVFKVDMTRIVRLREKEKTKYEQRNGAKLTYMPFITRATVQALRKYPVINAGVEGEAVRYNRHINIGIAVALEWGLIVPVIKHAEEKSFLGVTRAIIDLAERARSKKLSPDEVAGGTFTLTNSGIFGEQFGTPIIAQPQSAILGIGGLNKEPMVLTDKDGNDSIAVRNIQRFTLGFDHRIIDGSDAGKFMSEFKAYLENWTEDIG